MAFSNNKIKGKKEFFNKGTCSRTFFYILNKEFGHPKEKEEWATDLLAGGINQMGYQCGMLWGASLGVGAQAYRLYGNTDKTIYQSINTTKMLMLSFKNTAGSIECEDITNTDFSSKWDFAKYMITGKFYNCFRLADKWGQESVDLVKSEIENDQEEADYQVYSCASEVMKKLNSTQEEVNIVSGFAGGLGLSGSGCGVLSTLIWKVSLETVKRNNKRQTSEDQNIKTLIETFHKETDFKIECSDICGRKFNSIKEHSEFIKEGGCSKLIRVLSETAGKMI